MTLVVALLVPLAYLVGTVSIARLVARRRGHDPLAEGSGNPGATNVARLAGWRAGLAVLVLDFAKGAIPAGVGLVLAGRFGGLLLGTAAVVGHVFPATRRLRGGKGVATAAGVMVVVYPWVSLGGAAVFFTVARVAHATSVASVVIAVGFPVAIALLGAPWPEVVVLAALGALVVLRHLPNLRRIVRGTELDYRPDDDREERT